MRLQQAILDTIHHILQERFQSLRSVVNHQECACIAENYLHMKQALTVAETITKTSFSPTDTYSQELGNLVKKIKGKLKTNQHNWEFPFIYTIQETLTENYQAINTLIQSKQLVRGAHKIRQFEKLCNMIDQCPWDDASDVNKFLNIKNRVQKHIRERTSSLTKYTKIIQQKEKILHTLSRPSIKLDLSKTSKVLEKIQKNSQRRFSSDPELHHVCQQNIESLDTQISKKLISLLAKEIKKKHPPNKKPKPSQHQINFFYREKSGTIK